MNMSLNKIDTLWNENHIDSLSNKHLDKDNFIDYENLATEYSNIQEDKSIQKKIQSGQADLLIDKLMKNTEEIKLWVINNYEFEKWYELVRNILESSFWEDFLLRWESWSTAVYTSNSSQDIVYKLSTKDVLKQIYAIIDKDFIYTDNWVYKESVQRINTEVAEVFPKWTVLCPKLYVKEMDISPEVIKQFCKDAWIDMDFNNLKDNYTIPVTYTTQSFAHEIADKSWVSFNFDHTKDSLEKLMWKDIVTKAYSKIWPNSDEVEWLPPKDILIFLDRKFDLLLEQIYSISPDKSKVKEFFSSIINYSKQHTTWLDIFWFHNFTFFKSKNGTLDFHVIDPIFDGKATCDFSLHKTWGKWNIKNGEDFNKFSYPYIIEKMEKYIQS